MYLLQHSILNSANLYPDNEAFRCNDKALTYKELTEQSHQLAHLLTGLGVQRGDRVGIYLNRCLETAVAVYGILSAGAVFVPLAPYAPPSRTQFVLQDCGIQHLISNKNQIKNLKNTLTENLNIKSIISPFGERVISPSRGGWGEDFTEFCANLNIRTFTQEKLQQLPHTNPKIRTLEDDLAYIMYTSGTTGTPKGIMHTHRSGLAYAKLSADLYNVHPNDRFGSHAALHFDVATMGYFTIPFAGATTVIIPDIHTKLPVSMSQLIEKERLTIWYSVTFALIQVLQSGVMETLDFNALRWILYCGEPFPAKHLRSLMQRLPKARFSNVYGPAEVNQCTYYHLPKPPEADETIPLGKVWDNTEMLIFDENDAPVKQGETGELLIRSATQMKGYWNKPDLTEKGFYRQQKITGCEEIFYRTGDLVRVCEEGNLHFLGRKDRQVKVRGYRIELDEVEAALTTHEAVESAAIFAVKNDDEAYINAVVVLKKDLKISDLKLYLSERLPAYAVPSNIKFIDAIPRTSAGKVNYKILKNS